MPVGFPAVPVLVFSVRLMLVPAAVGVLDEFPKPKAEAVRLALVLALDESPEPDPEEAVEAGCAGRSKVEGHGGAEEFEEPPSLADDGEVELGNDAVEEDGTDAPASELAPDEVEAVRPDEE